MIILKISRTSSKYIYYALQLHFSGLSFRKTAQRPSQFIKRNLMSIWNWIQRYKPKKIFQTRCKLSEFIIDETLIKIGWLCMVMGCSRADWQDNSWDSHLHWMKHACSWTVYMISDYKISKTQYFNRWRNMVHEHANSWMWNIIIILRIKKVLLIEQSNT
jgi:hypothetical protein